MKLSEAIKTGRTIRPQIRGAFRSIATHHKAGTCDLGAAYEALTGRLAPLHGEYVDGEYLSMYQVVSRKLHEAIPEVGTIILCKDQPQEAQSAYGYDQTVWGLVLTLNDGAEWPTEKTVAWLESRGL